MSSSLSGSPFASVAQSVEQGTENPRVIGSIPIGGTKNPECNCIRDFFVLGILEQFKENRVKSRKPAGFNFRRLLLFIVYAEKMAADERGSIAGQGPIY